MCDASTLVSRGIENISRERENYIYGWLKPAQQQRYSVSTGWRDPPPPFVLWPATHTHHHVVKTLTLIRPTRSIFFCICVCMSPWFLGGGSGRPGSPKRINLITRAQVFDSRWVAFSCFVCSKLEPKKGGRKEKKKRFGCQVNNLLHGESPLLLVKKNRRKLRYTRKINKKKE
jgi:hypothetical protein